jgi:hypothetical protein
VPRNCGTGLPPVIRFVSIPRINQRASRGIDLYLASSGTGQSTPHRRKSMNTREILEYIAKEIERLQKAKSLLQGVEGSESSVERMGVPKPKVSGKRIVTGSA